MSTNIFYRLMATVNNPIEKNIFKKLSETFKPTFIDVVNESYKHNVPKGSESHFKVVVVSEAFSGKRLIERHRAVNAALAEELEGQVHALSIQAKTPEQWVKSEHKIESTPPCLGGSGK